MGTQGDREHLRDWIGRLERETGWEIGITDAHAVGVETAGGRGVLIESEPGVESLLFTADLGTLDETASPALLRGILASNFFPNVVGPAVVGLNPDNGTLVARFEWLPDEADWSFDGFSRVLAAFTGLADSYANALQDGSIAALNDMRRNPTTPAASAVPPQFA